MRYEDVAQGFTLPTAGIGPALRPGRRKPEAEAEAGSWKPKPEAEAGTGSTKPKREAGTEDRKRKPKAGSLLR